MSLALVFPGQGSQSVGMLGALAADHPVVRSTFAEASRALGYDLWERVSAGPAEALNQTECTQPAMLVAGVATYRAWQQLGGPAPTVVTGHSLGEFTALTCAGTFSFADAVLLVRDRGRYMQEAVPAGSGAMAAILGLEDEAVENLCRKIVGVWPANYNCPGQIVISGENGAVEELCAEAESLGARRAIKLKVSGAFHSPLVARAADRLKPAIDTVRFTDPIAPFMSTVTARVEPATRLASLLVDQLTAPVKFTQAARELVHDGVTTFVEVGPGNVLSGLIKRIDRSVRAISINDLASLEKAREALST